MSEQDERMKKVENLRNQVNEIANEKAKLSGQLDTEKKRLEEIEQNCRDQFGCEVSEIPDKVEQLDKEANDAITKAERLLNQNKDGDDQ